MKNQALFSLKDKSKKLKCCLLQFLFGALRVKPWPADLADQCSISTEGGYLFKCTQGSIAHSLSSSASHHPDMTEILLKRMQNCIHPSLLTSFIIAVAIQSVILV